MVLFVDIFGTAFDLPDYISPCCYDINQDIFYGLNDQTMKNAFDINREELLRDCTKDAYDDLYEMGKEVLDLGEECKHNSLYDALVIRALYNCFYNNYQDEWNFA